MANCYQKVRGKNTTLAVVSVIWLIPQRVRQIWLISQQSRTCQGWLIPQIVWLARSDLYLKESDLSGMIFDSKSMNCQIWLITQRVWLVRFDLHLKETDLLALIFNPKSLTCQVSLTCNSNSRTCIAKESDLSGLTGNSNSLTCIS